MATEISFLGKPVRRFVEMYCPVCGDTVPCGPGPLSEDGVYEFRTCEDGHSVRAEAIYYTSASQATEFGIV